MKKSTKLFSLVLAGCLLASSAAGCSNSSQNSSSSDSSTESTTSTSSAAENTDGGDSDTGLVENTLPITTEDVELTLYCHFPTGARQVYKDMSEHPVVKIMMEQTGLKLNFIHAPENDDGTFFNTTIASGVYPDLFMNNFSTYPGGPEAAMEDGILRDDLTDMVFKYAPNFVEMYNSQPDDIKTRFFSDNGNLIRFGTITNPPFLNDRIGTGILVRKDLLDQYGLEAPNTIDEYETVLQTFKDNGVDVPLSMPRVDDSYWKDYSVFASAFNVPHDGFYLKDGEVVYSRIQPEYKEYLTLLNDWYNKGYLTADFTTQNLADAQEIFKAGRAGMVLASVWHVENFNTVGQTTNPDFFATGIPYMKADEDAQLHLSPVGKSVNERCWFVSATCEHPVEAVKFIDYLYLEDTQLLTAMGPGNEEYPTYEIIDGVPTFTDFMTNNPDFDLAVARDRYTANSLQIAWFEPMEMQQYGENPRFAYDQWHADNDDAWKIPSLITPTVDEARELSSIMNSVNTYTDEMITKMIVGDVSLDDFDKMVADIEAMNIGKATEIQAAATERYNNRKVR